MFKMRSLSSQSLLVQLCLVNIFAIGRVAAALAFTNPSLSGLTAGEPFTLTWSGASGTTTLTLQNGNPLQTVDTIACKFADVSNTSTKNLPCKPSWNHHRISELESLRDNATRPIRPST
jgi:hypothetical protein